MSFMVNSNSVTSFGTFFNKNNNASSTKSTPTFTPAPSVEAAGSIASSAPATSSAPASGGSFSAVC